MNTDNGQSPRGRGRPAGKSVRERTAKVELWVTAAEKQALREDADKLGVTLSDLVRSKILSP